MRTLPATCLALLAACGADGPTAIDPNGNAYGITATGPGVLSVLPLDSTTWIYGSPLGSLAPPGHVLPTDHVYISFVDPWNGQQQNNDCRPRPVRAAGSGVVDFTLVTESQGDTKVEVQMTRTFFYYYDHVLLAPGIKVGSRVQAGDVIATTTGRCPSIDLGVIDLDVTPSGHVAPERYGRSLHVASPYRYFVEPLRSFVYSRVRNYDGVPIDRDGRTDYGIRGRLSGDWFHSTLATADASVINGPTGWSKSLSFAYDWTDGTPRISIGGVIATPGVLAPLATDPDPRTVDVARGMVVYTGTPKMGLIGAGYVMVQMVSDTRIRIEYVPASQPRPTAFTSAAQEYVR